MKEYRQSIIMLCSKLTLELAQLRIERESWREAPVIRNDSGQFSGLPSDPTQRPQIEREINLPHKIDTDLPSGMIDSQQQTAAVASVVESFGMITTDDIKNLIPGLNTPRPHPKIPRGRIPPEVKEAWQKVDTEKLAQAGVDPDRLYERLQKMVTFNKDALSWTAHSRRSAMLNLVTRAQEMTELVGQDNQQEIQSAIAERDAAFEAAQAYEKEHPDRKKGIERRYLEATALDDRVAQLAQGLAWRTAMLNTEIEHGDDLDYFLNTLGDEDARKEHQAFLKTLHQKRRTRFTTRIGLAPDTKEVLNRELDKVGYKTNIPPYWKQDVMKDWFFQKAKEVSEYYSKISPVPLKAELDMIDERAFHVQLDVNGETRSVVNIDGGDTNALFHEYGHIIEVSSAKRLEKAIAFRTDRRKGKGLDDMWALGMPGEKVVRDDFKHPYVGKVYPGNAATEVVSTGLESLADQYKLKQQATRDREHLMFAISELKKEPGE